MSDLVSRQAAIELVRDVCNAIMSGCDSYYDPETDDEVYKDLREVDAILKCNKEIRIALRNMPFAEPEIIRCKDCKWWGREDVFEDGSSVIVCKKGLSANPEGFCHYAEMREGEQDE